MMRSKDVYGFQQALGGWRPEGEEITVLIGPEGGLAPAELQLAQETGFLLTSLGPFVLRTEVCATAILGVLVSRLH